MARCMAVLFATKKIQFWILVSMTASWHLIQSQVNDDEIWNRFDLFFNAFYCWRGQETIRFCFCYFLLHSSLFKWSSLRPKHKKNVSIKHEKGKRFQRFENFKSHLMSIKWANLRTNFALRIWDFFSPVFSVFECFETWKEKSEWGRKKEKQTEAAEVRLLLNWKQI